MKILLIMAADESEMMHTNNPIMPLALPLLAATAPEHHYTIIDLLAEEKFSYDDPVDLVGISARFTSEERAFRIADEFRKRKVPVVLGGPQMSATPFEAINHADAVVVGEGEKLWPVLLNDLKRNGLKQFYVCSSEPFSAPGYSIHQITEYLNLEETPAALRYLAKGKYVFDTTFASRGCPIDCDFCYVPAHFGKKFRLRPIEDVVGEIKTFKRRFYYLIDDTVFGKPSTYDYYYNLYDAISKLKKVKYWMGQANLDAVAHEKGREVIRKAREAGFLYASVGIESVNPATLEKSGAIRKMGVRSTNEALERIREHLRFIQDLGIIISGWFVLGYEDDTIETYYQTYEFCKEMHILPAIFPVNALPGTRLYARMEALGRIKQTRFSNIAHPGMNDDDIEKALKSIIADGYSFSSNVRRIRYYLPRFKKDKIHNTIFLWILQGKMRQGVDATV